jgi:hypothetical protein
MSRSTGRHALLRRHASAHRDRPYVTPVDEGRLPRGASIDSGVETADAGLGTELQRGRSTRTRLLALTGVGAVVGAVFAVVVVAALVVYFLA